MQFKDYQYQRPDVESFKRDFNAYLEDFNHSESVEEQNDVLMKIMKLRNTAETMFTLASIRSSINTKDEFYDKEKEFADVNSPLFQEMVVELYKALLASKFRPQLEQKWGKHIFNIAEVELKTFSPEVITLMQEENKLASEYQKLRASAEIEMDGKILNLAQMVPYRQSKDRKIRQEASEKMFGFFAENQDKFDELYDKMVKLRHKIAVKLGFDNYVQLGYYRLVRTDYTAKDVAAYRQQVAETLVPVSLDLKKRQQKRLGLSEFKYYDEPLNFLTGNPTPKGEEAELVASAKLMYSELSPETKEFFDFMTEHKLMDLVTKAGKAGGGYCTYMPDFRSPFIFSNFNGTSHDVDVLTHEAGHAFQVYQSRDYALAEYVWPTYEACEIHSMSMEFFAWPWMDKFFKEDEAKYKFSHLEGALNFIPYGVTVDEFQHYVYENPEATPAERRAKWREIEKKYLPYRDYDGNKFLEDGGFWFMQGHIFTTPFYYIDYTLAQVCAFEFWGKQQEDRAKAWADYLRLCRAGGSDSFLNLLKVGNLHNPFIPGTIAKIIEPIKTYLDNVDDSKF